MRALAGWLLLGLGTLAGCSSTSPSQPETQQFEVLDHPVECITQAIQGCLVVRFQGDTGVTLLHEGIQGFAIQWGYQYQLEVDRFEIENPPADGPSVRWVLKRVISESKVPAGTTFQVSFTGGGPLHAVGSDRYRWFNSPEFTCPSGGGMNCGTLASAVTAGERIEFTFRYTASDAAPLELLAWRVCASSQPGSPCTQ